MSRTTKQDNETLPLVFEEDQRKYVTIRNDFHDIAYHLDTFEQKMFFEVLARIDSFKGADQVVSLTIKDLNKIGVSSTTLYRKFQAACDKVLSLSIRFYAESKEDKDGNRVFEDRAINIFTEYGKKGVTDKSGRKVVHRTTFAINPRIANYLTEITKDMRFTMILLEQARKLKKAASIRLYQWLRKTHWISTPRTISTVAEMSTTELMDKLDFNDKNIAKRKSWRSFKRNVLDPACADINESSDLQVWYDLVRSGRGGKIQGIVFYVKDRESEASDLSGSTGNEQPTPVTKELPLMDTGINVSPEKALTDAEQGIKTMLKPYLPNISDAMARDIAKYEHQVIFESMLVLAGKKANGEVNNPESLFISILLNRDKEFKESRRTYRAKKSTVEKLTDRSWVEQDLGLFSFSDDT